MAQLNVLPVDVSQSTDYKAETSQASTKEQNSDERFAVLVDRHLGNEKKGNNGKKPQEADDNGNKTSEKSQEVNTGNEKIKSFPQKETGGTEVESKPDKAILKLKAENSENDNNKLVDDVSIDDLFNVANEDIKTDEIKEQTDLGESRQTNKAKQQDSSSELEKSEFFISLVSSAQQVLQSQSKQEVTAKQLSENIIEGNLPETGKSLPVEDKSIENNNQGKSNKRSATTVISHIDIIDKIKGSGDSLSKDSSIFEPSKELATELESNIDNKKQLLIKDIANATISSKGEAAIKPKEQLHVNDEVLVNELSSEGDEERIDLSNQAQVAKPSIKIEGSLNPLAAKHPVNVDKKNSELSTIAALVDPVNEKMTIKDIVETTEAIQAVSVQSKSATPTSPINSQENIKITIPGQQAASNQSEQHKESNSEEHSAAQVDVISTLEVDAQSTPNEKSSQFTQQVNSASSTSHSSDVYSQITKTRESEIQQSVIEEVSHAIVSENNIQTKNNAAALNETISIFRKDFAEAVKEKVMVMISQKLQQFDIRLDPPELGNVHVRVNLQSEQAVVNFMVQNQQAKEAFEENLNKLKDMLAEHGVDVGDANVEQQSQQSDESETGSNFNNQKQNENKQESAETVLSANLFKSSSSNIDYYA